MILTLKKCEWFITKYPIVFSLFQMSMQFGLDAMAGGHPGVHGLGDSAKLGQHFADRYTGLQ